MSKIIQVSNLSKSYTITHEGRESYTALRDVVATKAKKLFSFGKKSAATTKEEFWALKDINFDIEEGDRIGIIGRNGAGKSTLLKILSRITEPTSGNIKIRGRVASLLEVGTGFHPELTGRENIFLNGAILGMNRAEIRKHFDAIVDFAEIEKFLDTPVKRYSSGMYMRLAFAVAAHLEPEILVVDEVLAVGDAQFQKKCLGKMEDVSKNEGRTVVFVSHDIAAIEYLTSKCLLLQNGRIKALDQTAQVIRTYLETTVGASDQKKKSSGRIIDVLNYSLLDKNNAPTNYYQNGDPFKMQIELLRKTDDNVSIDLILKDSRQSNIAIASLSNFHDIVIKKSNDTMKIELNLQPFNLASGKYFIDIMIAEPKIKWDLHIDNAIEFEVMSCNPNGWDLKDSYGYGNFAWYVNDVKYL